MARPSWGMALAAAAVEDSFIFIAAIISRLEMTRRTFVGGIVIKNRKTRSLMAKTMSFPQMAPDDDTSEMVVFAGRLNKRETNDSFYMEKGFSLRREVPEKPWGMRVSLYLRPPKLRVTTSRLPRRGGWEI
ncbi:hypothetical protein ACLOJK_007111 [Asimina triloba]